MLDYGFAAGGQVDQALFAELRELAAHGLDGQAQHVRDLLAGEGQFEGVPYLFERHAALGRKAIRHVEQECRELLLCIHPSEQEHPAPRPVELRERAFEQFVFEPRMFARKAVEVGPLECAHQGRGKRLDAIGSGGAERATHEIARISEAEDLFFAVARLRGQFEEAIDHVGDHDRLVAFPEQLLARIEVPPATDGIEDANLGIVQIGTNGAIADGASLAEVQGCFGWGTIHRLSIPPAGRHAKKRPW